MMKHSFLLPRSLNYACMQQRPHHLLAEFSKAGHDTYFINEDCSSLDGAKSVGKAFKDENGINILPQNTDWKGVPFDSVYFSYPPAGNDIIEDKESVFSIFDSLDSPQEGSPFEFWNAGGAYYKALARANLVLTTSDILLEEAEKYSSNVLHVPNAVDFDFFNTPQETPDILKDETRPKIGYFGAISQWMDFGLIYMAARAMPECLFVFIGSSFVQDTIPPLPNVKFLGHIPYSEVPSFVQSFDISTIPFIADRPEIVACNPIKLWESFSLGLPVVTTAMHETNVDGVYWSQSTEEYIENLHKALDERGNKKRKERIKVARKNTWKVRADTILKRMEEML